MSKDNSAMLIDDYPVLILPKLAEEIGLNKAIVLQQIHFWLSTYAKKNDAHHFDDDHWWVWNTYDEWQTNFPWWSTRTIQRIILELEKDGYLLSRQANKSDWDKTKHYTIDYDKLDATDSANLSPSSRTNGRHLNRNTEITTQNTTEKEDKPNALAPSTPGSLLMFEKLKANAEAKDRRPPKQFKSLENKAKFEKAEAELTYAELQKALTTGLESGILAVTNLTNYIAKWKKNEDKFHANRASGTDYDALLEQVMADGK